MRNNNSLRFGKLITIEHNGSIAGGSVISYLLEKPAS
jgi:myosin heavy subunit